MRTCYVAVTWAELDPDNPYISVGDVPENGVYPVNWPQFQTAKPKITIKNLGLLPIEENSEFKVSKRPATFKMFLKQS